MPTHKKRPLLYATLTSVFSQKYDDYEFIVVDASSDKYFKEECDRLFETHNVLKRNFEKKQKMKIVYPEKDNNFPGAMKMLGFKNCIQDNDFVLFLDHDDFLCTDILHHVHQATIQYPQTEMISSYYTSMIYNNGRVYNNIKTYAGGEPCDSSKFISIGDMWFEFDLPQDIYCNKHPYLGILHPKILSKKLIRDHRFTFIEDTERMDDYAWEVLSHAFIETVIPLPGYVYMGYDKSDPSNSCISSRKISETAINAKNSCEQYKKFLDSIGYTKQRNIYIV